MHLELADIVAWIGRFLWPFERIGAVFMVAPVFSAQLVPKRLRLGLAFIITVAVLPFVGSMPAVSPFGAEGLVITFQQLVIGAAIGFILALVFQAISIGGQVIAMTMGLGFAYSIDPEHVAHMPVVSQYFLIVTTLLFLALNGHLVLIKVIANSFHSLPVGTAGLGSNGLWALLQFAGRMFEGAVRVALPAVVGILIVNLSFGVMSRAAPTLNLFAVGFPVTMFFGIVIVWLSLGDLLPNLQSIGHDAFGLMGHLLAPGG
jgi:flagellar biosynthetic protein FliR